MSSLIGIAVLAPAGWTRTQTEPTPLRKEDNSGTLRQGLPGRRIGGGTRGGRIFVNEYDYLAALVTADNLSTTTAEQPSLIFYLPEMVNEQTVEFVLRNAHDEVVYETSFQAKKSGGMVRIEATDETTTLALNETYQWYFSIVPDPTNRSTDVTVYGNIQRVDPAHWLSEQQIDLAQLSKIEQESPLVHARMLHQEADLWHDAAIVLENLLNENPADTEVTAALTQLLEVAGLSAVVEIPTANLQAKLY
ncbi:MAG: DUF928 domain-containing protein [Cyanobacteria bacterium J06560_2]